MIGYTARPAPLVPNPHFFFAASPRTVNGGNGGDGGVIFCVKVKGVASNVPVLPAGSTASRGEQPDRGGNHGGDRDDSGRRTEIKRQRRQEKEKHNVVLDEIAPKETGRQATLVRGDFFFFFHDL